MKMRVKKTGRIPHIVFLASFVVLFAVVLWGSDFSDGEPRWGVTFSHRYAKDELGLDPKETYRAILDELNVPLIRLVAYWNEIEQKRGERDWSALDWYMKEAERNGKEVTLAIGYRVPRWPECFIPEWAQSLSEQEFESALLAYLTDTVAHYTSSPALRVWQVENEPLLSGFGKCPTPNRELLKKEVLHVKSLDPSRPILLTASGELNLGAGIFGLSEIFGTTLYRIVWNKYIGWFEYPLPPAFYMLKAFLIQKLSRTEQVVIAELQAEPWGVGGAPLREIPLEKQTERFDVRELDRTLAYAKKTGIHDIYLWGVEWWYWRKIHGDPAFWELGKRLLNPIQNKQINGN